MIRTIIAGLIGLLVYSSGVQAVSISLQPQGFSQRFPPIDRFHNTCMSQLAFMFDPGNTTISSLKFDLVYGYDDLEIVSIVDGSLFTNVNKQFLPGKVSFMFDGAQVKTRGQLFTLLFKSKKNLTGSRFEIRSGSFVREERAKSKEMILESQRYQLLFADVPECDPDVLPPLIELISHQPNQKGISPDSVFQFRMSDAGKGVDRQSFVAKIGDFTYTMETVGVDRSGDIITVRPIESFGFNQPVVIDVSISDRQQFGGSNMTQQQFSLTTTLPPKQCQQMGCFYSDAQIVYDSYKATPQQCDLLVSQLSHLKGQERQMVNALLEDIGCKSVLMNERPHGSAPEKSSLHLSVLGMMGWLLFAVTFLLKLTYINKYKHLKIFIDQLYKKYS